MLEIHQYWRWLLLSPLAIRSSTSAIINLHPYFLPSPTLPMLLQIEYWLSPTIKYEQQFFELSPMDKELKVKWCYSTFHFHVLDYCWWLRMPDYHICPRIPHNHIELWGITSTSGNFRPYQIQTANIHFKVSIHSLCPWSLPASLPVLQLMSESKIPCIFLVLSGSKSYV